VQSYEPPSPTLQRVSGLAAHCFEKLRKLFTVFHGFVFASSDSELIGMNFLVANEQAVTLATRIHYGTLSTHRIMERPRELEAAKLEVGSRFCWFVLHETSNDLYRRRKGHSSAILENISEPVAAYVMFPDFDLSQFYASVETGDLRPPIGEARDPSDPIDAIVDGEVYLPRNHEYSC